MSDDFQQLILETREQIATARRLRAEYHAKANEYVTSNAALHVRSRYALERSIKALAKG